MKTRYAIAVTAIVAFTTGAGLMWAQQQQASHREPQFENDEMKTWKSVVMPNQPLTLHRHEHGRALVALTDGELDVVDKNNKKLNQYNLKAGHAIWLSKDPAGQMHADVNPGTKPVEVIVVELKNDK